MGGVLADDEGRVRALWAAFTDERKDEPRYFFAGIGVAAFAEPIEALRHDRPVGWRGLDAELRPIPLADARARGLSESDARAFEAASDGRRTVLSVARLTAGTPTASALEVGDLLRFLTRYFVL